MSDAEKIQRIRNTCQCVSNIGTTGGGKMTDELKKCPKCGGVDRRFTLYEIFCADCGYQLSPRQEWNRRTI